MRTVNTMSKNTRPSKAKVYAAKHEIKQKYNIAVRYITKAGLLNVS